MKQPLRKQMRAVLAAMPPQEAAAASRRACERLTGLEEFRSARAVMIYVPMPGELDVTAAAQVAWQAGKTVLAPHVLWDRRLMAPVVCRSLDERDLSPARFGVREPLHGELWPVEKIDFIVVPGLAFDRRGHRLGRGGGFYDRFLASPALAAVACGVGFAQQVVDELPISGDDHPLDVLVTDTEVLRFSL